MSEGREGKNVTKEEFTKAVASKEQREVTFGMAREVPHECLDCGSKFNMTMYDTWYEGEHPKVIMPFYIRIDKTCDKCGSHHIVRLKNDGTKMFVPKSHVLKPEDNVPASERPEVVIPAIEPERTPMATLGFNVMPLPEKVAADGGTMGKSESRKKRDREEKAKARGNDQKKAAGKKKK